MNGVADDLLSRASFDDATAVHDVDAVTDVARGCDVMGDVEDRHSFGLTQIRQQVENCLLYTSPSPRDVEESRMPSSA